MLELSAELEQPLLVLAGALAAAILMLPGVWFTRRRLRRHHADQLAAAREREAALEQALLDQELKRATLDARLQAETEQCERLHDWWQQANREREQAWRDLQALERSHAALRATLGQKEAHFGEQLQLLKDSREQLRQEFQQLASEIMERKGKAFSELSERNIGALLQPIRNEMKGFRDKVEDIHRHDTAQRASLRTELEKLQALNQDITSEARRLTEALQGQRKVQGNWGELMLENVLDGAGLREGRDYERERSFTTSEGRRRPDAIVHLPQGRHIVIDAKTSLSAYVRYVNADDDADRAQALAEHCRAVGDRIRELSDRHYYDLPGLNAPEVVVMFVPVESAYVEALRHDETLFQRAIEQQVLVATPTTLLASLHIVRQLWRFEDQSRHTAELARRAERFHDKLRTFLESMAEVGRKLDGAREGYDRAMGQLVHGRANLIRQAADFRELGVAVKRDLPDEFVERARMELAPPPDAAASDGDGP